jgi:hypothetical protein
MHPAVIPHLPSPTTLYGFSKLIYCMYAYVETKIFSPGRITLAAIDTSDFTNILKKGGHLPIKSIYDVEPTF